MTTTSHAGLRFHRFRSTAPYTPYCSFPQVHTMPATKQVRILCYTVTLVISLYIAVHLFSEFFVSSGFSNWIAVKLYQTFDDKTLRILLERVCTVIALIIAGFLFFAIFFRSGFSRWLKNYLLRISPDPK